MAVSDRVAVLIARCAADLGEPASWVDARRVRGSLALCIVESIQSTRSHYTSVERVLDRYCEHRIGRAGDPSTDNATDLIRTFGETGGPDAWANLIGNRKPTSTNANAPLKAEAIHLAARALVGLGVDSAEQFRDADPTLRTAAEAAWRAVPGQRSGLTWSYLGMLTGAVDGRSDHLVSRYLADAMGTDLLAAEIPGLVDGVAHATGVEPDVLAHSIWRFRSGRPVRRAA